MAIDESEIEIKEEKKVKIEPGVKPHYDFKAKKKREQLQEIQYKRRFIKKLLKQK